MDSENFQDTPILNQPQFHRTEIVIWNDLSLVDIEDLLKIELVEEYYRKLGEIFSLSDNCKKDAIMLDFYYYLLRFAKENHFSKPQTSAFFSIMKMTHCVCVETPYWNSHQCFQYFKDMVSTHAVKRPPFSIDLFSVDQAKLILEYGINTYFRNFKLYKYAFTPKVNLDLRFYYNGMPPTPEPEGEEFIFPEDSGQTESMPEETLKSENSVNGIINCDDYSSELKKLVRQHLMTEMTKLTSAFDEQIKLTANEIKKKIHNETVNEKAPSSPSVKKDKKK